MLFSIQQQINLMLKFTLEELGLLNETCPQCLCSQDLTEYYTYYYILEMADCYYFQMFTTTRKHLHSTFEHSTQTSPSQQILIFLQG